MNSWELEDEDNWSKMAIIDKIKCITYIELLNKFYLKPSEKEKMDRLAIELMHSGIEPSLVPKEVVREILKRDIVNF